MEDVPQFNWDVVDALMKGKSPNFESDGVEIVGGKRRRIGPA